MSAPSDTPRRTDADPAAPLLRWMVQHNASDLHLKPGVRPALRLDGRLEFAPKVEPLTGAASLALARAMAPADLQDAVGQDDIECAFEVPDLARFRASITPLGDGARIVVRRVPLSIAKPEELGIPPVAMRLVRMRSGLVLVTGPTGSGKSSTLASLVDWLNRNHTGHIVTLEDPVEFVHTDQRCLITQRQIGRDCPSFAEGLRRALRQDPDVIILGELRDLETMQLALTAAETGHLVLSTMHTSDAARSIHRIVDAFPSDTRAEVQAQLGSTLQGILSQTLLPRVGGGRIAAFEVLIATEAVRSCIREGKAHQLVSLMQTGGVSDMTTMTTVVADLVHRGVVGEDAALAEWPGNLELEKLIHSPLRRRASDRPLSSTPAAAQKPVDAPATPTRQAGDILARLKRG